MNYSPARTKLLDRTAEFSTDQLWLALEQIPAIPTNAEEALVRSAIIEVLEARLPEVAAAVDAFYDADTDEAWSVTYKDALLAARAQLA